MKTLLTTLILAGSLAGPTSAFYFPEVATGDGSLDWNDLFGNQKAREILNHSDVKEERAIAQYNSGYFKGNSKAYLQSATASFEFLTKPQVESYITNVGRILAEQTGQFKMGGHYSELPSLMYYRDSVKANMAAIAKGQFYGIMGPTVNQGFWNKLFSIPEGEERDYIHFMGQLGLT